VIIIDKHIVHNLAVKIRFVDYCIAIFPQLMSKNAVKKAIKREELYINNEIATSGHWMVEEEEILLVDTERKLPKPFPLEIPIVYEDEFLLIVNKPSGISVSGNQHRTLENALVGEIELSKEKDANKWAKPVHRLDHATSGLVLLSKTATTHRRLAKMFENKQIEKEYYAIITGRLEEDSGQIDSPINEQSALTKFNQLETVPSLRSEQLTLVQLFPQTGRTHQLRIHCAENKCPIVGDVLYGEEKNILLHKGLFLASTKLEFTHPITGGGLTISIEIPQKFHALLEREERRWNKYRN